MCGRSQRPAPPDHTIVNWTNRRTVHWTPLGKDMSVHAPPLAVVVEPSACLAETIADCFSLRGFRCVVSPTHAGAAMRILQEARVDFLVAAVPAPGEDASGAYLSDARRANPGMAIVIILSDPNERADDAPSNAIRLCKPFDRATLEDALGRAEVFAIRG